MNHEQVSLSPIEVRELKRIEAELAMIDSADDGFATVEQYRADLRRRTVLTGVAGVLSGVLVIATFTFAVVLAFGAYLLLVAASVGFTNSLVRAHQLRAGSDADAFPPAHG